MGFVISSRDCKGAYLQSKLTKPGGPQTWVALPRQYWEASWVGKYVRPMVQLELSLFGHPEASQRWDEQFIDCTQREGYVAAPQWKSVFKRKACGTALGCYVDDVEMASSQNWSHTIGHA